MNRGQLFQAGIGKCPVIVKLVNLVLDPSVKKLDKDRLERDYVGLAPKTRHKVHNLALCWREAVHSILNQCHVLDYPIFSSENQ